MRVRIKFDADIVIEGDSMSEIRDNWCTMPLFSVQALNHGVEFGEVILVEDADSYDDLMDEFNE